MMNLQTALSNICHVKEAFDKESVECIRKHKDEAIPVLLERVKTVAENGTNRRFRNRHIGDDIYPMFLLAEFRVKEALPYLVKYLGWNEQISDELLGDILTDRFPQILACCADKGSIEVLKQYALNEKLYLFCRLAAFNALKILFWENELSRENFVQFVRDFIASQQTRLLDETICIIGYAIIDTNLTEMFDEAKELFKRPHDKSTIVTFETYKTFCKDIEREAGKYKRQHYDMMIDDVETAMDWFTNEASESESRERMHKITDSMFDTTKGLLAEFIEDNAEISHEAVMAFVDDLQYLFENEPFKMNNISRLLEKYDIVMEQQPTEIMFRKIFGLYNACETRFEKNFNNPLEHMFNDHLPVARQEPVRVTKVGRNTPCPCGSGKKHKKCCGQ